MITVLGIGPGNSYLMLAGTQRYLEDATLVIGSKRQLSLFPQVASKQLLLPKLSVLRELLATRLDDNVVLLASGDPLLYGIGTWAFHQFGRARVQVVPGISSIQYLFHQTGLSMNECYFTSSHGRVPDFDFLLMHDTIGMVTDDKIGPYEIAQAIVKRHQHRQVIVGEMLSYPEETITTFPAEAVEQRDYQMNVVIITNA